MPVQDWTDPGICAGLSGLARFAMELRTEGLIRWRQLAGAVIVSALSAAAIFFAWRYRYEQETNIGLMLAVSICVGIGSVDVAAIAVKFVTRIIKAVFSP